MLNMVQKGLFVGGCLLLVISSGFAKPVQCPSQDFKTFFNAFSENIEVQKAFTPKTLKRSYWSSNDGLGDYDLFAEKIKKENLTFPIIPNAKERKALNYVTDISVNKDSDRLMNVAIFEDESDVGWTYRFALQECWYLYNIESSLFED